MREECQFTNFVSLIICAFVSFIVMRLVMAVVATSFVQQLNLLKSFWIA